ncbi:MAG: hypothetical protein AAF750_17740 [Planctomycetota bacterium]
MSDNQIQPVSPPPKWIDSAVVKCEPGTRWWVERGPSDHFKHWLRELHNHLGGDLIPMQWVPLFVGVTRRAVRKRVDGGGLTAFSFVVEELHRSMLGKETNRETKNRYDYLVMSECEAWREAIIERLEEEEQERYRRENQERRKRGSRWRPLD